MAPPAGGGPPAGAVDIRVSITYVCALLAQAGVGGLSPEALRQAKFDASAPAERLWRALHDVAALALAGFPAGGTPAAALDAAWRGGGGGVPPDGARERRARRRGVPAIARGTC